jgi:hypothetical protein
VRIRSTAIAILLAPTACAGGTGGGRSDEDDGDDVADDTLGSTNVTNDTIDPTNFSTTGDSDTADETAGTDPDDTTAGTSDASSGLDTTATGGDGPTVVDVVPSAGATGVDPTTSIVVTFSAAMDPDTLVVDEDSRCVGAIQVSSTDFASCIAMNGLATADDGDTVFTLSPADPLDSATDYAVRVLADATSAVGVPAEPFDSADDFTTRYFHTIAIDGDDDWDGGETFPTSTEGHLAFTAWDDEYVYLAMSSPDVAIPSGTVWVVAYVGGTGGSTSGQIYNTQAPALPFAARWHLRWRADNTYTDVQEWDGDAWVTAPWQLGAGDVYQTGELVEFRIARSAIDDPDALELHMGILREAELDEASWAAHPEGSYVDGYDPDYSQYWEFDLLGSASPVSHAPSP